jgi:hypothetical protein
MEKAGMGEGGSNASSGAAQNKQTESSCEVSLPNPGNPPSKRAQKRLARRAAGKLRKRARKLAKAQNEPFKMFRDDHPKDAQYVIAKGIC